MAASGAGNQFGPYAFPKAKTAQHFRAIFNFECRVRSVRNTNGVANTLLQQCAEGDDGSNASSFFGSSVSYAEVQGVIKTLCDFGVSINRQHGVHAFGADRQIVKVFGVEEGVFVVVREL